MSELKEFFAETSTDKLIALGLLVYLLFTLLWGVDGEVQKSLVTGLIGFMGRSVVK